MSEEVKGMFAGPVVPVTLRLAYPIIIGNLANFLFVLVDTYFVSLIDPTSTAVLSGIGLIDPIFFCMMALSLGIQSGVGALVGRGIGENNDVILNQIPSSGLLLILAVTLPSLLVVYVIGNQFVTSLAGITISSVAIDHGNSYLSGVFPGIVVMFFLQLYTGILAGEGKTKIAATSAILFTVLNIVLDPVFIFYFGLGALGAGLATTISMAISFLYVLRYFNKNSALSLRINSNFVRFYIVKDILHIAIPNFFVIASTALIVLFFNKIVGEVSETAMNAWAIVCRMDGFILLPLMGITGCTLPMISQNYGRNQLDRVKEILLKNCAVSFLFYALVSLIYVIVAPAVFSQFTSNLEVVDLAVRQVRYLAVFMSVLSVTMVIGGAFYGVGKPLFPFIISYTHVFVSITLGYVLVVQNEMEMLGVICALATGFVSQLMVALFFVRTRFMNVEYKSI